MRDIYARGHGLRRRRRALVGSAAVLLVVLAAMPALARIGADDAMDVQANRGKDLDPTTTAADPRPSSPPTSDPPPSTSGEPLDTPTTTVTEPPPDPEPEPESLRPSDAVAVDGANRLVVIDTPSGTVLRTLDERPLEDGVGHIQTISLTPDRSTVYFSIERQGCDSPIYRIPVTGGTPVHVADGMAPSVSPDGRRLAYAAAMSDGGDGDPTCWWGIVVRDLASGDEQAWEPEDTGWDELAMILRITWAPDSRRLAFDQIYEGSGVNILDTSVGGTLTDASSALEINGSDDFQRSPTWLDDGDHVVVALSCCYPEHRAGANRIVSVSLSSGVAETVSLSVDDRYLVDTVADRSGRSVLHTSDGAELHLSTVGGSTITIPGDYSEVDW